MRSTMKNLTLFTAIAAMMDSKSFAISARPELSERFKTFGGHSKPSKRTDRAKSRKIRNKRARMQKLSRRINRN